MRRALFVTLSLQLYAADGTTAVDNARVSNHQIVARRGSVSVGGQTRKQQTAAYECD